MAIYIASQVLIDELMQKKLKYPLFVSTKTIWSYCLIVRVVANGRKVI